MPWCPKCKLEYREGYKICNDCNSELLEQLDEVTDNENGEDKEAYLTTVPSNIEAEMLEEILNSNKIPVLRKFKDAGGFLTVYMGNTIFGVDLFVPSKLLEKAREVLEGSNAGVPMNDSQVNYDGELIDVGDISDIIDTADNIDAIEEQEYKKKQRAMSCIAFAIFFPGLAFGIVYYGIKFIEWIF